MGVETAIAGAGLGLSLFQGLTGGNKQDDRAHQEASKQTALMEQGLNEKRIALGKSQEHQEKLFKLQEGEISSRRAAMDKQSAQLQIDNQRSQNALAKSQKKNAASAQRGLKSRIKGGIFGDSDNTPSALTPRLG